MFYIALIILKLIGLVLSLIPRPLFLALGRALGGVLFYFQFRTSIASGNLKIAFPDWAEKKREDLLLANYHNTGILFLELLGSFYRFDRFLEKYADVEGGEHLRAALAKGKGVFVMTAHLGNWEVLVFSGRQFFSTPVTMVTKELKPKWFHRLVNVTRTLLGVTMACEPKTMQSILRALKKKEIVGFVMDQYAGAPVGARVPFFGVPVGSHTALATLAARTGAPVIPAIAYRNNKGRFTVRFEPEIPLTEGIEPEQTTLLNTARYVSHTERWIREFPDQWMWIHRRWKGDLSPLTPNSPGEMLR